jgi:hypothetical protein
MKRVFVIITLLLLMTVMVAGANHYIRQGATGNGSDWNNALGQLPAAFVRGDTYYVADGNYTGFDIKTVESGTTRITVKKATIADHGTDTGWQDSYGDGQAAFDGCAIRSSYVTIDGTTGEGKTGHGFKFTGKTYHTVYIVTRNYDYSKLYGLEFRHLELTTTGEFSCHGFAVSQAFLERGLFEYNYLHDIWGNPFQLFHATFTIQYNYVGPNHVYGSDHCEGIQSGIPDNNQVITGNIVRYNIWCDIVGSGVLMMPGQEHEIYGNVFVWTKDFGTTINQGVIGLSNTTYPTYYSNNCKIYNNTFCNIKTSIYASGTNTNHVAYNNLFYNTWDYHKNKAVGWGSGVTHDYSWYYDAGTGHTDAHIQYGSGDPFVDFRNDDYRLKAGTQAGMALASPFDVDWDGNTRGGDGVWDRGAFEYSTTNIECRTLNAELRIPSHPTLINNWGRYNILGGPVLSGHTPNTGIYLVTINGRLQTVVSVTR